MSAETEKADGTEVFAALDEISQVLAKHGLQATTYQIEMEFTARRADKYVASMAPDERNPLWFLQMVMTAAEARSPLPDCRVRQVKVTE